MSDIADHRLPRTVLPRHYDLEIEPDLHAATFAGRVRIDIDVREPTSEILLNAVELTVDEATLVAADGSRQRATVHHDDQAERLALRLESPVEPGAASLELIFDGLLNDKLAGFYRSTFVDEHGDTRVIATTQFESTDARRAFPCWDEPDIKATFAVALVHDPELLAVSSGPAIERTEIGDGRVRTRFGTTMVMSTYLLAFVVGPLVATEPVDVHDVPLRVIHAPGRGHLTAFALDAAAFSLRHFAHYFDIPYPADKLDLVALPDFASGAMENLGCITFREALLLLDPAESTQPEQQRVADVIAHEVAHMWFGDLVTMKWWNGIWLKEAFATFCEMHATDAWRPEWKRWELFGQGRSAAFDVDSLAATRPIEFEVVSPDDAEAMYDVLTYEKGAAVVRMLAQYLGEHRFRDGIRHYLDANAYGNTETTDLWDAIEESSGEPARRIMDSWIFQGGYPLLTVERTSPTSVHLRQQRFGYRDDVADTLWSVPAVMGVGVAGSRRRVPVLFDGPDAEVDLGPDPFDYVVANEDASGFYRVELLGDLTDRLISGVNHLSPVERFGLVDDAWALVVADRAGARDCVDLVAAMALHEQDLAVWRRMLEIVGIIDDHLEGSARDRHRSWGIALVAEALQRIGHEPQPHEPEARAELRAALFATGGFLGDPSHIAQARELVDEPADPARTVAAIRIVAPNGDGDDFGLFVDRYENAPTPQEERRYLFALPRFRRPSEVARLVDLVDAGRVRTQDAAYVLAGGLANVDAATQVWSYVASSWEELNKRLPVNSIPRLIQGVQAIGDREMATAIDEFFQTHQVPQAGRTLFQHLERMWVTVRLRERLRAQLG